MAPPISRTGTGRILVVDDNEMLLELVSRILKPSGFQIVAAADAEEAVGF